MPTPNQMYEELCGRLDKIGTGLEGLARQTEQLHSRMYREWVPFRLTDGGTCAGGAVNIGGEQSQLVPAPNGWEARVERICIQISGASSAARADFYRGNAADGTAFFDFISGFFGSSPSVNASDYASRPYFMNGTPLFIVLSGAVATAAVTVRVEGVRREV